MVLFNLKLERIYPNRFRNLKEKLKMSVKLLAILATLVTSSEFQEELSESEELLKVTGGPLPPPGPGFPPRGPPQLIWHGENDIATVVNQAGEWSDQYVVDNMFDDSYTTLWHSHNAFGTKLKIIGFEFKVRKLV